MAVVFLLDSQQKHSQLLSLKIQVSPQELSLPLPLAGSLICGHPLLVHPCLQDYTTKQVKVATKLTGTVLCVKKNQPDAQLILRIFRQPLHVVGTSMPIIRRYNRMYTTVVTYWIQIQPGQQTVPKKNNEYQLLYTCGCTS